MRLTVSGAAYFACLDPDASGVPAESGWPAAKLVPRGSGTSAVYEVTPEQARDLADWLLDYGEGLMGGGFDDNAAAHAEGRACLKAAVKIEEALR